MEETHSTSTQLYKLRTAEEISGAQNHYHSKDPLLTQIWSLFANRCTINQLEAGQIEKERDTDD